jgi:hypothetical protein
MRILFVEMKKNGRLLARDCANQGYAADIAYDGEGVDRMRLISMTFSSSTSTAEKSTAWKSAALSRHGA